MDSTFAQQTQQLADMVMLTKVVDEGSFSAAARALGLTKSAVSKQIQRLESSYATRLLNRTTRKLSLTEAGRVLYEHAEQVARLSSAAQDALAQLSSQPAGVLRMTSSVTYGKHVLAPLLPAFCQRYPDVRVALTLVDRFVDLTEEGFDLAIRLTAQPPEGLTGRPLHRCDFVVCASPSFLRGKHIRHPQDLGTQPCLSFSVGMHTASHLWHFKDAQGHSDSVAVRGPVAVNSSDVVRELVLSGMGVGLLPRFAVQADLGAGRLRPLLPSWQPEGAFGPTAWALWQGQRHMPPKIRVMIDYLAQALAERG